MRKFPTDGPMTARGYHWRPAWRIGTFASAMAVIAASTVFLLTPPFPRAEWMDTAFAMLIASCAMIAAMRTLTCPHTPYQLFLESPG